MDYRPFGRTGVKVSPLCLGTMNFGRETDEADSFAMINRALDAGINFIDTANVYTGGNSERIVGKALKDNGQRDKVFLATKGYGRVGEGPNDQGGSRYHIMKACEDSLRRLQTDHIDLYQIHRPSLDIPQDETLRALDDLVSSGKVRYIGCSTHPAWMVMEALALSEKYHLASYVSEQPPYNILDRRAENELIPLCQRYNLAVIPWSPLAGGILAGRYPPDGTVPAGSRAAQEGRPFKSRVTDQARHAGARVVEMAQARNLTASQFSLLWVKDQPGITAPIIGPRTMDHLEDALPVVELSLSEADREAVDQLVHPGNAVADFHDSNPWMKARIH